MVLLPALRPLRLLRVLSARHLLLRGSQKSLYLQAAQVVPAAAALLVLLSAVAMLDAERRSPDANLTSLGDALWWASTTITTVGYGDRYPVTGTGRLVARRLDGRRHRLCWAWVTASVASWFIEQTEDIRDPDRPIGGVRQAALAGRGCARGVHGLETIKPHATTRVGTALRC